MGADEVRLVAPHWPPVEFCDRARLRITRPCVDIAVGRRGDQLVAVVAVEVRQGGGRLAVGAQLSREPVEHVLIPM